MKLIGITGYRNEEKNLLNLAYSNAFTRKDVTPVILPVFDVKNLEVSTQESFSAKFGAHIEELTKKLDGLVISGGADLNPLHGEEENTSSYSCDTSRDFTEIELLHSFIRAKKPIMGICRGFQLIGRQLNLPHFQQDLGQLDELHSGSARNFDLRQEPCHSVMVYGDLKNYIFKKDNEPVKSMLVNSFHHQGFTYLSTGKAPNENRFAHITTEWEEKHKVQILASTLGVLEAFQDLNKNIFAVQWHPEEYGNQGKVTGYFIDEFVNKKHNTTKAEQKTAIMA